MNQQTKTFLDNLERFGASKEAISKLREDAESIKAVDNYVDKATMTKRKFDALVGSNIETETEIKKKEIKEKATRLATLHDNLPLLKTKVSDDVYNSTLEEVDELEQELITDYGFEEDEVKGLTFTQEKREKIGDSLKSKEKEQPPIKEREEDMSKYVSEDDMKSVASNMALSGARVSVRVAAMIRQAEKLGIEVTDQMLSSFDEKMAKELGSKNLEQLGEEVFGFEAASKKATEAQIEKRIEEGTKAGIAQALKDQGVPSRSSQLGRGAPIFNRKSSRETITAPSQESENGNNENHRTIVGDSVVVRTNKTEFKVPMISAGENQPKVPAVYLARRTRDDRVADASNRLNQLIEKNPDLELEL